MSYQPPSVSTNVVISNTIVSLPSATRVIALVGNSANTKSIAAESQVQPSNFIVNVNVSGLNTISRIYDFSGPGNSLYTFPSSGTGAFGSGYYTSGNSILWSVAANQYPVSTTPQIGNTYFVDYNYSGTTLSGSTILESNSNNYSPSGNSFSGSSTVPALLISTVLPSGVGVINVYSGSTTSSHAYSGASVDPSGAGWIQNGTNLIFTNGKYPSVQTAFNDGGKIPLSGMTYFVQYNYSGTFFGQTETQTSAYNNLIPTTGVDNGKGYTLIKSIASVSGTTSNPYPASGTLTGADNLGFARDASGWWLSGTTINSQDVIWNAVNPALYLRPPATVPPVADTFFIDYSSNKQGADFQPLNFVDFSSVVRQYGAEANWQLITSGVSAGSYSLINVNPLTLASKIAFQNNAVLLVNLQNSGTGYTSGEYLNAFSILQNSTVDIIVPLTIGSGVASNVMPTSERALTLNYLDLHCQTMSSAQNAKERVGVASLGPAEIGAVGQVNTYIGTATSIADKRLTIVAPGMATVQLQDPAGNFQNVNIDGAFLAVAVASLSCSPLNDVATPLTNQKLVGFTDIISTTPNHPNSKYLIVEKNNLAANGILVIDKNGPTVFVRHQLTTDTSNVVNAEFSVVTLIDFVSQAARFSCNQFIGKKLKPATTIPAVKGAILGVLQTLNQQDIISSIGAITVQIDPLNPTQLLVSASFVPLFPLNRILITFTINTLG